MYNPYEKSKRTEACEREFGVRFSKREFVIISCVHVVLLIYCLMSITEVLSNWL